MKLLVAYILTLSGGASPFRSARVCSSTVYYSSYGGLLVFIVTILFHVLAVAGRSPCA